MLKFLLGGVATVTGLALLFVASFGEPAQLPEQIYQALSAAVPSKTDHHPDQTAHANVQPAQGKSGGQTAVKEAEVAVPSASDPDEQQAVQRQLQELQKEAAAQATGGPAQGPAPQPRPSPAPQQRTAAPPPQPGDNVTGKQAAIGTNPALADAAAQSQRADESRQEAAQQQAAQQQHAAQQAAQRQAQQQAAQQQAAQQAAQQQAAQQAAQRQAEQQAAEQQAAAQQAAEAAQKATQQAAELHQQRQALEQQLQQLHEEMASASKSVASLHSQADAERRAVDALQQQQAAEQAKIDQLRAQRQTAIAASEAASKRVTEARRHAADMKQAQAAAAARAAASAQTGPVPTQPPRQQVARNDSTAIEAVLDRLRHQGHARPPPQAQTAATNSDEPVPSPNANSAYGQAPQVDVRRRLAMARSALVAGHMEAARQYLEEAQLQLVFRPVTPAADEASDGSQAAGDVAQALSMLGAGDTNGALQYVDRAMGGAGQNRYRAAPMQNYGYGQGDEGSARSPYVGTSQTAYGQ